MLWFPHRFERFPTQQFAAIDRRRKTDQVGRGRYHSAAGDFYARIVQRGVVQFARLQHTQNGIGQSITDVALAPNVTTSAVGNYCVVIIGARCGQFGRLADRVAHVRRVIFAGGLFDQGPQQIVAKRRVVKLGSRLEEQGIGVEHLERRANVEEMLGVERFGGRFIMPHARHVTQQQARGNRPLLFGKRGQVFIHGAVEIDPPLLNQLHYAQRP